MDDQTFGQLQQRIQRIFDSLVEAFGLTRVSFIVIFHRDRDDLGDDGTRTQVEIHPQWCYDKATLHIYVASFADCDDDQIGLILIHELSHYWLSPISRYGSSKEYDSLEERVCTEIAQGIRTAITLASQEVAEHWRAKVKQLEKEQKVLRKELEGLRAS